MYLLAPFILQNFKKFLRADPGLQGCAIFGPKMAHLCCISSTYCPFAPKQICFWKIWVKFNKKFFQRIQSLRMRNFWAQNGLFPQTKIFAENLLMNFVSFIHAYLHAKNQRQILIY